jgi:hypothetical protein
MNLQETIALIEALKANGATHFKSNDFEVTLLGGRPVLAHSAIPEAPVVPPPHIHEPIDPVQTQKAQDLIDLLKLKDDELVNKIFPDGAI